MCPSAWAQEAVEGWGAAEMLPIAKAVGNCILMEFTQPGKLLLLIRADGSELRGRARRGKSCGAAISPAELERPTWHFCRSPRSLICCHPRPWQQRLARVSARGASLSRMRCLLPWLHSRYSPFPSSSAPPRTNLTLSPSLPSAGVVMTLGPLTRAPMRVDLDEGAATDAMADSKRQILSNITNSCGLRALWPPVGMAAYIHDNFTNVITLLTWGPTAIRPGCHSRGGCARMMLDRDSRILGPLEYGTSVHKCFHIAWRLTLCWIHYIPWTELI